MGYFLFHGGSADHTGEDRVRGICCILPEKPEILCTAPEEDWRYGLAEIGPLTRARPGYLRRHIKRGDCYLTTQPRAPEELHRGVRRILWGWEPAGPISPSQGRQLHRFHRIIVTDTRSQALLHKAGLGRTTRLGPDPSFLVRRNIRPLGGRFRQDTVALCVSGAVDRFETSPGLLFGSYCHLIQWILHNTSWQIALIPYCVKTGSADVPLHAALKQEFAQEDRIFCREDGTCRELRGDISLCRCCIGTAGVIAGWSCGVPGLCLGASNRVQGLSETLLGTRQDGVIRVSSLHTEEDLTLRFREFLTREDTMRRWLEVSVPRYRHWASQWNWA